MRGIVMFQPMWYLRNSPTRCATAWMVMCECLKRLMLCLMISVTQVSFVEYAAYMGSGYDIGGGERGWRPYACMHACTYLPWCALHACVHTNTHAWWGLCFTAAVIFYLFCNYTRIWNHRSLSKQGYWWWNYLSYLWNLSTNVISLIFEENWNWDSKYNCGYHRHN